MKCEVELLGEVEEKTHKNFDDFKNGEGFAEDDGTVRIRMNCNYYLYFYAGQLEVNGKEYWPPYIPSEKKARKFTIVAKEIE